MSTRSTGSIKNNPVGHSLGREHAERAGPALANPQGMSGWTPWLAGPRCPPPVFGKPLRKHCHETSHCYSPSHCPDGAAHEPDFRSPCLSTVHDLPVTSLVPKGLGAQRVTRRISSISARGIPDRSDRILRSYKATIEYESSSTV
jgi:hypothetical protein